MLGALSEDRGIPSASKAVMFVGFPELLSRALLSEPTKMMVLLQAGWKTHRRYWGS